MIPIILVDDEGLALEYLKSMVDWKLHGYRIVGCATSGRRALELYNKTLPQNCDFRYSDARDRWSGTFQKAEGAKS